MADTAASIMEKALDAVYDLLVTQYVDADVAQEVIDNLDVTEATRILAEARGERR